MQHLVEKSRHPDLQEAAAASGPKWAHLYLSAEGRVVSVISLIDGASKP
jgi:hypothetical protein